MLYCSKTNCDFILFQYYKDTGGYDTDSVSSRSSQRGDGIAQVTRIRPWTVQPGHGPGGGHQWSKGGKTGGQSKTASSGRVTTAHRQRVHSAQVRKGSRPEARQVWGESLEELSGDSRGSSRGNVHESDFGGNVDYCGGYTDRGLRHGGDHGFGGVSDRSLDGGGDHAFDHSSDDGFDRGHNLDHDGDHAFDRDGDHTVDHAGDHSPDHIGSGGDHSFDRTSGNDIRDFDGYRGGGHVSSYRTRDGHLKPWSVTEVQDLDPLTSSAILESSSLDVSTEIGKY